MGNRYNSVEYSFPLYLNLSSPKNCMTSLMVFLAKKNKNIGKFSGRKTDISVGSRLFKYRSTDFIRRVWTDCKAEHKNQFNV